MKRAATKSERGMITVEAVLSLVPFILVVLGIISFINVFMVHNKIQYAMYQVGSELAAYTYFYQALGVRDADLVLKGDADRETEEIDATISDVSAFLDQLGKLETASGAVGKNGLENIGNDIDNVLSEGESTLDTAKAAIESGRVLLNDPQDLMRNVVYFGIENLEKEVKSYLLGAVASSMIENYLETGYLGVEERSAGQYLKTAGVKDGIKGLDFGNSELFSDDELRMIDIVVEYDVEVYFLKLFKKDPTIHVVQRCVVPAWLDGDGRHYTKE